MQSACFQRVHFEGEDMVEVGDSDGDWTDDDEADWTDEEEEVLSKSRCWPKP